MMVRLSIILIFYLSPDFLWLGDTICMFFSATRKMGVFLLKAECDKYWPNYRKIFTYAFQKKKRYFSNLTKMASQEKALKELIEINFVKMMDGVPVRSSIEMVKNKRSSKIFNRIDFQPQKWLLRFSLRLIVVLNSIIFNIRWINWVRYLTFNLGWDKAAVELLKNEEWGGNTALIVGYPKTGSHFLLSILHNLGFKRMYGQKDKNGNEVNSEPLEFQTRVKIKSKTWLHVLLAYEINGGKLSSCTYNYIIISKYNMIYSQQWEWLYFDPI